MKILNTEKAILSLENVRRVDLHTHESRHTHYGTPYTITNYEVWINYTDQTMERLSCGEDEKGHVAAKLLMDKIFAILSEKS
jgi:hypothetical protein